MRREELNLRVLQLRLVISVTTKILVRKVNHFYQLHQILLVSCMTILILYADYMTYLYKKMGGLIVAGIM